MRLEFFFVVFGSVLLAFGVIAPAVCGIYSRASRVLVCVGLGISFIAAGLVFHGWNRGKMGHAPQHVASKPGAEPIVPAQAERIVRLPEPRMTVKLSYFAGTWKNVNPPPRGITRLHVRTQGDSVWVRAWEKCHPTDCDWGEASGTAVTSSSSSFPDSEVQKVTATFQTSFSDTMMTLTPVGESTLEADTQTRVTDHSGRSGYSATYTLRH